MVFETLYKKTKTGAIQSYQISVNEYSYTVLQGQIDGKKQEYVTRCWPKNVGRSNESTAEQQALSEATSKYAEKVKSGYSTNPSGEITVKLPMKISNYQDHKDKVTYPCYLSPKLNGVNATYTLLPDDTLLLTSRGGEVYPPLPHLEDEVRSVMEDLETNKLAGELYKHGAHLQDIMSWVLSPKEESKSLSFVIFDAPELDGSYETRRRAMVEVLPAYEYDASRASGCHRVKMQMVKNEKALEEWMNIYLSNSYEGTVITLPEAAYRYNVRSLQVFKYKRALDAEYLVVGYEVDKSGSPVLVCQTPNELTFSVKPKGTVQQRQTLLDNIESCIGRWYKIEYETLSKKNIPLKPVGICFRNCDASGNPLE